MQNSSVEATGSAYEQTLDQPQKLAFLAIYG
jgi:hypothetical protein